MREHQAKLDAQVHRERELTSKLEDAHRAHKDAAAKHEVAIERHRELEDGHAQTRREKDELSHQVRVTRRRANASPRRQRRAPGARRATTETFARRRGIATPQRRAPRNAMRPEEMLASPIGVKPGTRPWRLRTRT